VEYVTLPLQSSAGNAEVRICDGRNEKSSAKTMLNNFSETVKPDTWNYRGLELNNPVDDKRRDRLKFISRICWLKWV